MSDDDGARSGQGTHADAYLPEVAPWERRWSARTAIPLDVILYERSIPVAKGVSRDVGLEGMFVDMSWHGFSIGMRLEAEFAIAENTQCSTHRVPVVVVRSSSRGVGLMFLVFHQKVFRALESTLYRSAEGEKRKSECGASTT